MLWHLHFFGFWDRDICILYWINLPSFKFWWHMLQKWYFLWYLQLCMYICMCMRTCAFGSHMSVYMGNWGRCQWLFSINYFYIESRFLLNLKLAIWSSLATSLICGSILCTSSVFGLQVIWHTHMAVIWVLGIGI